MHLLSFCNRPLLAACCTFLSLQIIAAQIDQEPLDANKTINQIYHSLNNKPISDINARITLISAEFLGKNYLLGALGEGTNGDYDQTPLYRTDAFDCETYVDTVVALALANAPKNFKYCINQIRYYNGNVSYINRNHFTCLDWNKNNQAQGFIADITTTLKDKHNRSIVKYARTLIDKPGWYKHKTTDDIRVSGLSMDEREKRLTSLKQKGAQLPRTTTTVAYIPLTVLFDDAGNANHHLFNQIPNAAIIEIVRPNWDLTKEIGTHLNISHLGFAIWKKNTLVFREASSEQHHIIDIPLITYLHNTLKSPTVKGINIQIVLPQKDNSNGCLRLK